MGRYHFYNESPNKYRFTDEDLGLTTDESDFDQYDFYYNLEELHEPPKMDDDTIIGGQLFGSLGYKFDESLSLLAGIRYMFAEDAKLFGVEDEVINSA